MPFLTRHGHKILDFGREMMCFFFVFFVASYMGTKNEASEYKVWMGSFEVQMGYRKIILLLFGIWVPYVPCIPYIYNGWWLSWLSHPSEK
jgi:TRAP-type C4-dicarboxylate transport system permease small subunit